MSAPDARSLGARLRRLRVRQGLTLRALEKAAGVSATHVSEIERGRTSPTIGALERIASALAVPVSRLLEREGEHPGVHVASLQDTDAIRLDDRGARLRPLSSGMPGSEMSLFEVLLPPGAETGRRSVRSQDVVVALAGRVRVSLGSEHGDLDPGDVVCLRSPGRLRLLNEREEDARVLWLTSPSYTL